MFYYMFQCYHNILHSKMSNSTKIKQTTSPFIIAGDYYYVIGY